MRFRSWWTADTPAARASRGESNATGAPSKRIRPEFGPVETCDDLDERRFAGAVFAHQRVDLATLQIERNTIERQHARERFGDGLDGETHLMRLRC